MRWVTSQCPVIGEQVSSLVSEKRQGETGDRIFGRRNTPPAPFTPEEDVRRLQTGADAVKPPGHSYLFSCPF
ncbi:hypothetical protein CEXT_709801 [Caerostris extrusa]|uniref:Uncharacterized protein n=1 Tax=Caerostris extrusa TaxID=172846 RepID=A0AAV4XWK3_CAEEX|nr:hypothetical protein CEXT_709801 [Caerostris extrusa]